MAIQQEIWIQDISEQLFQGVEFVTRSTDHSQFVNYKTVHVPQAGSLPSVGKDRSSLPATAAQRTDTDLSYSLSEYTTDPMVVRDLEEIQTAYNKRQSVLGSHMAGINDRIGKEVLGAWAGSLTNVVETSGADSALALPPSGTGTRKKLTMSDIRAAALQMDLENVPGSGRVLILPAAMYYELFDDTSLINRNVMGKETLPTGVIDQIFGFDIYILNVVNRVTTGGTLKAVTTAGAAGDRYAGIAYHPSFVSRAIGDIKVYQRDDDPTWYGSIFSAMMMVGASKLYSAETGIVSITQTTGV